MHFIRSEINLLEDYLLNKSMKRVCQILILGLFLVVFTFLGFLANSILFIGSGIFALLLFLRLVFFQVNSTKEFYKFFKNQQKIDQFGQKELYYRIFSQNLFLICVHNSSIVAMPAKTKKNLRKRSRDSSNSCKSTSTRATYINEPEAKATM